MAKKQRNPIVKHVLDDQRPEEEIDPARPELGIGAHDVHRAARAQSGSGRNKDHRKPDETFAEPFPPRIAPAITDILEQRRQQHEGGNDRSDGNAGKGNLLNPHPPRKDWRFDNG